MKKYYKSFIMALSMFTIIPTPFVEWDDEGIKNMMKFYPLVGLIIGCIWSVIFYLVSFLNVSIVLKSVLVMIVPFIITGMLHLDGFMDVCDAILSRREKEEKLRILKDSTIGAFAVVCLVILFFVQFGAVYSIIEKSIESYALLLIPVLSRSIVAYFLLKIVTIKESSLGTYFKKGTGKSDKFLMIAISICIYLFAYLLLGYRGIIMSIFLTVGISLVVFKCVREFGGISGDVSGCALVIGEVMGLLGLCMF